MTKPTTVKEMGACEPIATLASAPGRDQGKNHEGDHGECHGKRPFGGLGFRFDAHGRSNTYESVSRTGSYPIAW